MEAKASTVQWPTLLPVPKPLPYVMPPTAVSALPMTVGTRPSWKGPGLNVRRRTHALAPPDDAEPSDVMEVIYSAMAEGLIGSMAVVTMEGPPTLPDINSRGMMRLATSEGPNVGALIDTAQMSRAGRGASAISMVAVVGPLGTLAVVLWVGSLRSVAVGCRIGGASLARRCDHAMPNGVALEELRAPMLATRFLAALLALERWVKKLHSLAGLTMVPKANDVAHMALHGCGSIPLSGCTCRASAYGAGSSTPSTGPRTATREGGSLEAMSDVTQSPALPTATAPAHLRRLTRPRAEMGRLAHPATG